jgi:hypothetical protein
VTDKSMWFTCNSGMFDLFCGVRIVDTWSIGMLVNDLKKLKF